MLSRDDLIEFYSEDEIDYIMEARRKDDIKAIKTVLLYYGLLFGFVIGSLLAIGHEVKLDEKIKAYEEREFNETEQNEKAYTLHR